MSRRAEKDWPKHFDPKPGELTAIWPTARTQTYVDLVLDAIRQGAQTSCEIQSKTKLKDHQVGTALANLILWSKQVKSEFDEHCDVRRYFLVNEERA